MNPQRELSHMPGLRATEWLRSKQMWIHISALHSQVPFVYSWSGHFCTDPPLYHLFIVPQNSSMEDPSLASLEVNTLFMKVCGFWGRDSPGLDIIHLIHKYFSPS